MEGLLCIRKYKLKYTVVNPESLIIILLKLSHSVHLHSPLLIISTHLSVASSSSGSSWHSPAPPRTCLQTSTGALAPPPDPRGASAPQQRTGHAHHSRSSAALPPGLPSDSPESGRSQGISVPRPQGPAICVCEGCISSPPKH